jgi:hypothetical protein
MIGNEAYLKYEIIYLIDKEIFVNLVITELRRR